LNESKLNEINDEKKRANKKRKKKIKILLIFRLDVLEAIKLIILNIRPILKKDNLKKPSVIP